MNDLRDPFLDLPLDGLRLIEASAGTGKTFTLATLATRLVIERGLRVGQILAVTFTEAATQELRERLRRRLTLAAGIAAGAAIDETDAESALTRAMIQAQLQHEDAAVLRARLQRAAYEIDLAAVFTIHGFCARVLSEHALQTGQSFVAAEMIGSDRDLRDEVAADLWRALGADPVNAELLQAQWSGPNALAADLGALMRAPRVLPPPPPVSPDPIVEVQRTAERLKAAFGQHGSHAREQLDAAIARGTIDGRKARKASYEKAWAVLASGLQGGTLSREDSHLDKLLPKRLLECAKAGREHELPQSPLCEALADWFEADAARAQWLAGRAIALVHQVRADAAIRLAMLKRIRRVQTYDDLIDGVAAALDGPQGEQLAEALRRQYAFALVDEFQDTDPRQWAIFERVFAADSLFLIGDPKQAIYRFRGGDVHTYLGAKSGATPAPPLDRNFRSRPALLRAVAALYRRAGIEAFVDERIRFQDVQAAGAVADADYLRGGHIAPALSVRMLPAPDDGRTAYKADESRELAARACVAEIHALLRDARDGSATIDGQRAQPGDIAVLVRTHDEAARMLRALSAAGIPAVAAGKQSLFATEQAQELLAVFEALLQPGDDGRLRGALATVLLGFDAADIARMDADQDWHRGWQLRALSWRERWQRQGPLALVADLCAEHAPRLLALADGERRLTNLLQLGEALQEADARALGSHGLVDALRRRIAEADPDDETQQLRLESDARRVQVMTLHKSKGLEFPLVFLPFAGIGKGERNTRRWCEYPGDGGRVLQLKTEIADAGGLSWDEAGIKAAIEERAEDARLLYVGLTRAQHALWLAAGPLYQSSLTPLSLMLVDLAALQTEVDGDSAIETGEVPAALAPLPEETAGALPAARIARRSLSRDWWVYSFTQLTGEAPGALDAAARSEAERGAEDEPEPLLPTSGAAVDWRFSGSRFGNVLHAALEQVDFPAWQGWRDGEMPPGQEMPLRSALRAEGYAEADLDDGIAQLATLVGNTLNAALPEGTRLCELPPDARRAEMEFHFALQPTSTDALLALLHAHGLLRERQAFGLRRRLEGLMTGKIDLVYVHAGRYYLLDYKSNRLPAYDPATLDTAMADSEYTLQALIYTLALHRWLRFRLGDSYDYARDFGGVRYLFCRGLDASGDTSSGLYARTPPQALVEALDALFAAREGAA